MLIDVPPIIQREPWSCAEAAVECVARYHSLRFVMSFSTAQTGATPEQIEAIARKAGLLVTAGEMTVEDLRYFCNSLRPVITPVHWPNSSDSHYVVVRGVQRGKVHVHDVECGKVSVTLADWDFAWAADGRQGWAYRRWGIVLYPKES